MMKRLAAICATWIVLSSVVYADDALIAVASNFTDVAQQLETAFEAETGHQITIAGGSTGSLYAQILHGAPYDVLLAADQDRPILLENSGNAISGSRFTYATGRLALWSANAGLIQSDLLTTITQKKIVAFAIANPDLAPYGIASREALLSLHVWDKIKDKIVMGENIGQAHALVATGNAQAGLVALSLVENNNRSRGGAYLVIPEDLHAPVRQDAVLLRHGENNSAATGFVSFLQSSHGKEIIRAKGYGVD